MMPAPEITPGPEKAPETETPVAPYRAFADLVAKKKVTVYAAASDYYIFMSLVPILMLFVSFIKYLPFSEGDVMAFFADIVPDSVYGIIQTIVDSIYQSGGAVVTISILLTVFLASRSMRSLMVGLDAIYDAERTDNTVLFFLRACLYMVALVIIILLCLIVMVYGGQILLLLRALLPDHEMVDELWTSIACLRFLSPLAILFCAFLPLFRWVPAGKRRLLQQWPGALFCALAWVLFSGIFSLYVSVSDHFGAYGYIGTIMVAMMWLYYCLLFLLIGGCINALYAGRKKPAGAPAPAETKAEP